MVFKYTYAAAVDVPAIPPTKLQGRCERGDRVPQENRLILASPLRQFTQLSKHNQTAFGKGWKDELRTQRI